MLLQVQAAGVDQKNGVLARRIWVGVRAVFGDAAVGAQRGRAHIVAASSVARSSDVLARTACGLGVRTVLVVCRQCVGGAFSVFSGFQI